MTIAQKVYKVVSSIPKGKVMTYGEVAKKAGTSPRAVGRILHINPTPIEVPCHRVVFSNGSLSEGFAFGGIKKQKELLVKEGVKINKFKVLS